MAQNIVFGYTSEFNSSEASAADSQISPFKTQYTLISQLDL